MTYDPHATLAAWLDSGWESDSNDYEVASCFVKPDAPAAGWGVSIGTWQQGGVWLHGFGDAWDAWAFVFAATGIDPHEGLPSSVRLYESKPQPDGLAVEDVEPVTTPPLWAQFSLFQEVAA